MRMMGTRNLHSQCATFRLYSTPPDHCGFKQIPGNVDNVVLQRVSQETIE